MSTQDLFNIPVCCAICQAPPEQHCPHESDSLERALGEAQDRWRGSLNIRKWVLEHARREVLRTFNDLKHDRLQAHNAYLARLPCYTVYARYQGNPPIDAANLHSLRVNIQQAEKIFIQGINEDWRKSCLMYPVVLDYFFGLVTYDWPEETDPHIRHPRYGHKRVRDR